MWTLSKNKDWGYLTEQFSWVSDMVGVPQDPSYHAEGSVDIHTQMVINQLDFVYRHSALPVSDAMKEILWASALLHDVEKRSTTQIDLDKNVITSPGHAKKGEYTARTILYKDIPTPFFIRESIAKLVRYHGYPLWFMDKNEMQKTFIRNGMEVDYFMLTILATADVLGRKCIDKMDLLTKIELFDGYCQEQDYNTISSKFKTDIHKFEYFNNTDRSLAYEPFDTYDNTVYMMSGLPGSGKDTYIQANFDLPVVSLDRLRQIMKVDPTDKSGNGRVVQTAKEQAKEYLRKKQSFVLNSTNITRSMRQIWIDLFTVYKAKTNIIYVEVPYKTLMTQNSSREAAVPTVVVDRLVNKLEIPALWEGFSVEYKIS